ncbi:uncharacterized protein ACO6RY_19353 [Pungitius sinensis]
MKGSSLPPSRRGGKDTQRDAGAFIHGSVDALNALAPRRRTEGERLVSRETGGAQPAAARDSACERESLTRTSVSPWTS